jgi:alpha-acetolactate decarboxylase
LKASDGLAEAVHIQSGEFAIVARSPVDIQNRPCRDRVVDAQKQDAARQVSAAIIGVVRPELDASVRSPGSC